MQASDADPKGLVRESYGSRAFTPEQCRSVFIDWALSLPATVDLPQAIHALLAEYDAAEPGHPMGRVLREGLIEPPPPRRRGGRAARVAQ